MTTRFIDHLLEGDHASRPAANAVPMGALYACSDHALIYQSDTSSWATWADIGGSAGGITRTQLGTTSLGASFDTTLKLVYKKITCASAGLIASIAVGMKGQSSASVNLHCAVMSDNAGTPLNVIADSGTPTRTVALSTGGLIEGFKMNATARFATTPIGLWVAAGDYWLVVNAFGASGNDVQLAFASGTGSDRTKASTDGIPDHSVGASSSGTNDYSIFANFLT